MTDSLTLPEQTTLRAQSWDEFIGQDSIRTGLKIAIDAAKNRQDCLEHILLYGPPGLGKTTLANLIAKEMGVNLKITSGPALERAGDLASILTSLEPGDVIFIDEIHRLNKVVEETLYPAMEDYSLDLVLGKGPAARTMRLELNRFTLIGATTQVGAISAPLRDRFGVNHRLNFYTNQELAQIITNAAAKLDLKLDQDVALLIAARSRKTARIALKLLRRIRDYAQIKNKGIVSSPVVINALDLLEIDELGLEAIDRKLLREIALHHNGGPVGLETLAAIINEDVATVKSVQEPYLLRTGLLKRTARGRVVTPKAYSHLKLSPPPSL